MLGLCTFCLETMSKVLELFPTKNDLTLLNSSVVEIFPLSLDSAPKFSYLAFQSFHSVSSIFPPSQLVSVPSHTVSILSDLSSSHPDVESSFNAGF